MFVIYKGPNVFGFIKKQLQKIYTTVTQKAASLFSRTQIDQETLKELEVLLISADTGVKTTRTLIANLKEKHIRGLIQSGQELKEALKEQLITLLTTKPYQSSRQVFMIVGINGSGKTTFLGKLAHFFVQHNKRVLIVAGDTFRAAAPEQLAQWATRSGADIVIGKENQDPASVIYAGCEQFKHKDYDILLIDTAGRLQTKVNLMHELEKIKKTITKLLPEYAISTLLTIDAMLGQNSFHQAQLFNESTDVDGIVLTKMDGTGKGGIVIAITQELKIPIAYISYGEQPDQFKQFDVHEYVQDLLG